MTLRISSLILACGVAAAVLHAAGAYAAPPTPQPEAATRTDAHSTDGAGTTIISGQESPIGLYITPWKNAFTKQGMYSPVNHRMQILPEPVDPDTFHLQTVYYDTIQAYRAKQLGRAGAQASPPASSGQVTPPH